MGCGKMGALFIVVGVLYVVAILAQVACYKGSLKKPALKERAGAVATADCH
jgi:hypothetical protein